MERTGKNVNSCIPSHDHEWIWISAQEGMQHWQCKHCKVMITEWEDSQP